MSQSGLNGAVAVRRAVAVQPSGPSLARARTRPRRLELESKLATLQKDYADLHSALFEAAQVFRKVCAPHLVRYNGFEIASEIFAVRHLPGDFFTVQETSSGLVLALGDICGKGLAAGMWTTYLVGLIRTHIEASSDPTAIASAVNRDLCRMSQVAPLTSLFVARLASENGTLDYSSAGHPPALLLRANGSMEALGEGGPLLGVIPAASFTQGSVKLDPADVLLACSDGILEAFNSADQEFGYERLETELRRSRSESTEGMLFSVLGSVQDFAASRPLADDMSVVVIRRR